MFTGLIDNMGVFISLDRREILKIEMVKPYSDLSVGESISVNGACLTLIDFDSKNLFFQVSPETLRRTNIGFLKRNDLVNLERALKIGDRLGGHIVLGHVDCLARIESIRREGNFKVFSFALLDDSMSRYIVEKGSIAVDGISLTVNKAGVRSFEVMIVGHTLENTNLQKRKHGDLVNIEVDIIGKYIERFLDRGITKEKLAELGF